MPLMRITDADQLCYSVRDAAETAGVSSAIIRREIAEGRLAARYSGRMPRISSEALKTWLETWPQARQGT